MYRQSLFLQRKPLTRFCWHKTPSHFVSLLLRKDLAKLLQICPAFFGFESRGACRRSLIPPVRLLTNRICILRLKLLQEYFRQVFFYQPGFAKNDSHAGHGSVMPLTACAMWRNGIPLIACIHQNLRIMSKTIMMSFPFDLLYFAGHRKVNIANLTTLKFLTISAFSCTKNQAVS